MESTMDEREEAAIGEVVVDEEPLLFSLEVSPERHKIGVG